MIDKLIKLIAFMKQRGRQYIYNKYHTPAVKQ